MWKGVYFTQSEYFFHSLKFENSVLFSPGDDSEMVADAHACEGNVWVPTNFPQLFLSSQHIKLWWKMMKPNIEVEKISFLLTRIHHKMENYFCISAEILMLPDEKGLLCYLTLFKDRLFPVVSQSTHGLISKNKTEWPLKMFTCKMGHTVAITQKTFSANFWYQQMNKRLLQLLQLSDFQYSAVFIYAFVLKWK